MLIFMFSVYSYFPEISMICFTDGPIFVLIFVRFLQRFFVGKAEEKRTAPAQNAQEPVFFIIAEPFSENNYSFIPEFTILLTKYF